MHQLTNGNSYYHNYITCLIPGKEVSDDFFVRSHGSTVLLDCTEQYTKSYITVVFV